MPLRLYNTLTRQKEDFAPIDPANVRLYACGPTVYDHLHIGNGRMLIVFDVLFRLLRHEYGADHVTYVRNITDVDDKINDRAARDYPGVALNEAIRKVTEETYQQYQDDVAALGCLPPTVQPRATEHIPEMRTLIDRLVEGGFAYAAEDHVLFSPQAMNAANSVLPRYGALANRSLDEMIAGARVDVAPYKRDATDFVLWKPSKPGEPSWPSPSGIRVEGRPGWHIECSAMSWKHLGKQFDIHGGGIDLVFPHHENELAQSCCAFHENRMANFWMHNGFLQVEGEKMSKSLGNFVTIRELLADWPGEVLRLNMLKTHYRSPIDWTLKGLEESSKILDGWYDFIGDCEPAPTSDHSFVEALRDDLNTPSAIARLHQISHPPVAGRMMAGVTMLGDRTGTDAAAHLKSSAILVGLLLPTNSERKAKNIATSGVDSSAVELLLAARTAARARKDFKESDRIRDELAAMGVVIKDSKEGTTWEIAR